MNIYYVVLLVRNYRMSVNVYADNEASANNIAMVYISERFFEDLRDIDVIKCTLEKAAA